MIIIKLNMKKIYNSNYRQNLKNKKTYSDGTIPSKAIELIDIN